MHETVPVQVADRAQRLRRDLERQPERRRSADPEHFLERQPGDVLHDDESVAVVGHREVVEHGDRGMAQPDGQPGLAQEAVRELLAGLERRADDLDDADLVEEAVADPVHRPHPPLLDLLEDLVLAFDLLLE